VDAPPVAVTELLEILHRQLDEHARPAEQRLVAMSKCGFPEAEQNEMALRIQRCFAHRAGFTWAGGLAMGGGEVVEPRDANSGGTSQSTSP
jgi:hypothetical protein